ncbi:hypothetical protein [Vreelandella populi]|uniref:Uncharacterized protein n=1 Tax=Vreelandella populi TaxID=2498858 RepID=A0A3S0WMY1_9GAMM|nr:hypothetical protein [Halomonas populi]RUR42482.1 hypothetical protein ELY25_00905 [Halomonas populi]RUR45912.1 hypothetical protein ELY37_07855 [Halomonas populi]RUR57216.1 hypothetical protein ELY40_02095 [Halomonas populi]
MSTLQRHRLGGWILFLAALAGVAISLYAYLTPLTGVTGTLGALAAILGCAILAGAALALFKLQRGAGLIILRVLILLGLAGTFFAAILLHQWLLAAVLVIGLVGLVIDVARPSSNSPNRI